MSAPKPNNILRRNRGNNTTTTTTTTTNPTQRPPAQAIPDFAQIQPEQLVPTPEQQRRFERTGGFGTPPKEYRLRFYCLTCQNRPNHNGACATAKKLNAAMPTRFAWHYGAYSSPHVWDWELGIEFCPPLPPSDATSGGAPPAAAARNGNGNWNVTAKVKEVVRAVVGPLKDPAPPAAAAATASAAAPKKQEGTVKKVIQGLRKKNGEKSETATAVPTPVVPPPFKVDDFLAGLKAKGVTYKTTPEAFP
ncbi:uncharacterized protein C8A04DRAFT_32997 [Dichotomopilus funicola]|uniref:Uncharacterized protein n=1 Tax=Dichotomopilus funicola TaxID=1934379 RepID=A0AAN6ZIB3_9PEZI|nr:hypothetical protein C8A04DRAFT_32997 [Dichotomopilus funicola]